LLALLKLVIRGGIVRIARAEKGGTVGGEGFEGAFVGVNIGFVFTEALVYF